MYIQVRKKYWRGSKTVIVDEVTCILSRSSTEKQHIRRIILQDVRQFAGDIVFGDYNEQRSRRIALSSRVTIPPCMPGRGYRRKVLGPP